MNAREVATQLLASLNAPRGAVSVAVETTGGEDFILKVWIIRDGILPQVPTTFMGHAVVVQKAPRAVAH